MNRRERRAGLAFARSTRGEWHPFERVEIHPFVAAEYAARQGNFVAGYRNNRFAVQVFERVQDGGAPVLHLAIRRHDGEEIHGWSDLQRIKAELVGAERVALEVYPAESELEDSANMRHIFVLPEGTPAPFTIRGAWT